MERTGAARSWLRDAGHDAPGSRAAGRGERPAHRAGQGGVAGIGARDIGAGDGQDVRTGELVRGNLHDPDPLLLERKSARGGQAAVESGDQLDRAAGIDASDSSRNGTTAAVGQGELEVVP